MFSESRQARAFRPWELIVNGIAASSMLLPRTRRRLYRSAGMKIETFGVRPGCIFHTSKISIAADTLVGARCHFENREPISIGKRCSLAPEVMIATSSHEIGPREQRAGAHDGRPVVIGDGCWLGMRVTVLPGVTIGSGCIVAAGAVVIEDCERDGLYAGVPARRVRDLEPVGLGAARR